MKLDKDQILSFLREQGDTQKAEQADEELPGTVDTDRPEHANLLEKLGIDPMELVTKFTGGGGMPGLG